MQHEEQAARLRHPAMRAQLRRQFENDQLDAAWEETRELIESMPKRQPPRARAVYDVIVFGLAGALAGIILFLYLAVKDGAL